MGSRSRRRFALPIIVGGVVALAASTLFMSVAAAKLPPNTSGDVRATYHEGNVQPNGGGNNIVGCVNGLVEIPAPAGTVIVGSNITIPAGSLTAPFSVFVKGGPAWNQYDYVASGGGNVAPTLAPTQANLTNLHPPVNNGGNIAGISHWFICGNQAPPPPLTANVYLGYADNGPFGHPAPSSSLSTIFGGIWAPSSSSVNFVGAQGPPCPDVGQVGGANTECGFDAGAIRIDNPTASPLTIGPISVTVGTGVGATSYQPWGSGTFSIPAGGSLILTQSADWNFDTSDDPHLAGNAGIPCGTAPSVLPVVHITTTSAQTVTDSAGVLFTLPLGKGGDALTCGGVNESIGWTLAGTVNL